MKNVFDVVGLAYNEEALEELRTESDDWSMSRKELLEEYSDGDRLYRYEWPLSPVEVVPEPENEHDPNALKVLLCGKKIGYVKKDQTDAVRALLGQDLRVWVELEGGEAKVFEEDEDEKIQISEEDDPIHGELIFAEHTKPAEPAPAPEPKTLPAILFYILGGLLVILSVILIAASPIMGIVGVILGVFVIFYGRKMARMRKK